MPSASAESAGLGMKDDPDVRGTISDTERNFGDGTAVTVFEAPKTQVLPALQSPMMTFS